MASISQERRGAIMTSVGPKEAVRGEELGKEMHDFIVELYPICRSITGEGVRETLRAIRKRIPLEMHEVPSGTKVFDWTVPLEWNVTDAYVMNRKGKRVIDFKAHNLHLMSYSLPVKKKMIVGGPQTPFIHAAGASRMDSVPNFLLQAELGFLPSTRRS